MTGERRRFYRIEDKVLLSLQPIDRAEIDACLEDFWANEHEFSIRNNYNFQIEQHIADRHKIETSMPELGRYLAVFEKQIDRITELLIGDQNHQAMTRKTTSLSAQGIAFYTAEPLQLNALVELKLKLLPSGLRLVIIARVVQVEKTTGQDQGDHRVSLDFENLHEADREILIKHLHCKQIESLGSPAES